VLRIKSGINGNHNSISASVYKTLVWFAGIRFTHSLIQIAKEWSFAYQAKASMKKAKMRE